MQNNILYPKPLRAGLKRSLIGWGSALVVLGGIFVALVLTNTIALSRFKTIEYTNSSGTRYSLLFYTRHTTTKLQSGNTELVSKVSEDGKFPLTLSIANGDESSYTRAKDCSSLPKVFDVQNTTLNQMISVCNFDSTPGAPKHVYVAAMLHDHQTSIVTISQDVSGVDLSSQSGALASLPKFGLDPYGDDIKQIVASLKFE